MKKTFLFAILALSACLLFVPICTNAQTAQNNTSDQGVVINGVKWATRNVDAPGTFAANSEDAGMFYQWNSKIGWSSTDPMINSSGGSTWNNSDPTGDTWETTNDPSPKGWHIPTLAEIQTLLDNKKQRFDWTTVNGINGLKITDTTTGNSIFLPATGTRMMDGALLNVNNWGNYWSSMQYSKTDVYYLLFFDERTALNSSPIKSWGYSIRSVADNVQNSNNNSSSSSNIENSTQQTMSSTKYVSAVVTMYPNADMEKVPNTRGWYYWKLGAVIILNSKGYYMYSMEGAEYRLITTEAVTKTDYSIKGTGDGGVGKYYIDSNNVIHFTTYNGFEDTGNISYDDNRRIVISYLGKTLREHRRNLPYIYDLLESYEQ